MGTRLRPDGMVPWMPGYRYGALLPSLSLNLIVRDTERSVAFYRDVLGLPHLFTFRRVVVEEDQRVEADVQRLRDRFKV